MYKAVALHNITISQSRITFEKFYFVVCFLLKVIFWNVISHKMAQYYRRSGAGKVLANDHLPVE